MVIVSKSEVICGKCKTSSMIGWDLELLISYEKELGICSQYEGGVDVICEKCGNVMSARLHVIEYPEGTLESCEAQIESESFEESVLETPEIEFFDL